MQRQGVACLDFFC